MRKPALLGLLSGLAAVIATLVVVALVNTPEAEGAVSARPRGIAACRATQVAQDQGYELTRKVLRSVCDSGR